MLFRAQFYGSEKTRSGYIETASLVTYTEYNWARNVHWMCFQWHIKNAESSDDGIGSGSRGRRRRGVRRGSEKPPGRGSRGRPGRASGADRRECDGNGARRRGDGRLGLRHAPTGGKPAEGQETRKAGILRRSGAGSASRCASHACAHYRYAEGCRPRPLRGRRPDGIPGTGAVFLIVEIRPDCNNLLECTGKRFWGRLRLHPPHK